MYRFLLFFLFSGLLFYPVDLLAFDSEDNHGPRRHGDGNFGGSPEHSPRPKGRPGSKEPEPDSLKATFSNKSGTDSSSVKIGSQTSKAPARPKAEYDPEIKKRLGTIGSARPETKKPRLSEDRNRHRSVAPIERAPATMIYRSTRSVDDPALKTGPDAGKDRAVKNSRNNYPLPPPGPGGPGGAHQGKGYGTVNNFLIRGSDYSQGVFERNFGEDRYFSRQDPKKWSGAVHNFSLGLFGEFSRWRGSSRDYYEDHVLNIFEYVDQNIEARLVSGSELSEGAIDSIALSLINSYADSNLESIAIKGDEYFIMLRSEKQGEGEWLGTPVTQSSVSALYSEGSFSNNSVYDTEPAPSASRTVSAKKSVDKRFQAATEIWKQSD